MLKRAGWIASMIVLLMLQGHVAMANEEVINKNLISIDRQFFALPFTEGVFFLDYGKLDRYVDMLEKQVYQHPSNAYWDYSNRLVPEKLGRKLNKQAFFQHFLSYYYDREAKGFLIPTTIVLPKVDRQLLRDVSKKQIGSYITYFNSGNKNRAKNIDLSARAIDNIVLFPGEIFSFNNTVGERTREKGYLPAPVIVKGELSEGVGGGICQVSSTLYNAVDKSGLSIVQRYAHSRNVAYVPPGRDATVSWNGPDFRFQNQYAYPILIRAKSIYGMMVVRVFSFADLDYDKREVPTVRKGLPEEMEQKESYSRDQPQETIHDKTHNP
ncbi:VanW family protein [Brevibacillus daliensis]|uniref:VanW family protein n=1 Tax=Brevibacillus daliensis TaxID=2892995 RepID=UPI001E5A9A6D|nr:VanW family protein [Brevibacillus daliensis]